MESCQPIERLKGKKKVMFMLIVFFEIPFTFPNRIHDYLTHTQSVWQMWFQAWKPSPSAWVVQMRSVSNTNYSQAANTFRQLCGHLQPWCWMRSWEDCGCGHAAVRPDKLSEEAALPPVACHKTDLLPNLLPPPYPDSTHFNLSDALGGMFPYRLWVMPWG